MLRGIDYAALGIAMDDQERETEMDRIMAGWPGLTVSLFCVGWMLLVAYDVLPGIGGIVGKWGKIIDVIPGMIAAYLILFGIVGGRTWLGKRIRFALLAIIVAALAISFLFGGSIGSGACTRVSPQFC